MYLPRWFTGTAEAQKAIEKALHESNDGINFRPFWVTIKEYPDGCKDAAKTFSCILKKEIDSNYKETVSLFNLIDTCIENCGIGVLEAICLSDFLQECVQKAKPSSNVGVKIKDTIIYFIQLWAVTFGKVKMLSAFSKTYENLIKLSVKFPDIDYERSQKMFQNFFGFPNPDIQNEFQNNFRISTNVENPLRNPQRPSRPPSLRQPLPAQDCMDANQSNFSMQGQFALAQPNTAGKCQIGQGASWNPSHSASMLPNNADQSAQPGPNYPGYYGQGASWNPDQSAQGGPNYPGQTAQPGPNFAGQYGYDSTMYTGQTDQPGPNYAGQYGYDSTMYTGYNS